MNRTMLTIVFAVRFGLVQSPIRKIGVNLNIRQSQEDDSPILEQELVLEQSTTDIAATKKVTPAIVLPALWIINILAILFSGYLGTTPTQTRATTWWEFLIFAFLYFNIATLSCIFIPENIDNDKNNQWAVNGGTGAGIAFAIALIFCSIYAKAVKVNYGYHGDKPLWKIIRIVALSFVMICGFACGVVVVALGLNPSIVMADQWLYAFGLIVLAYTVMLPLFCFCVCIFGCNSYQRIEEPNRTYTRREKSLEDDHNLRGGQHRNEPNCAANPHQHYALKTNNTQYLPHIYSYDHVKAPQGPIGVKVGSMAHQPASIHATTPQQSTGSNYYKQPIKERRTEKVKSISQYEQQLYGPVAAAQKTAVSRPGAARQSKTTPGSSMKRPRSQQSTGTAYYQRLMQGKNAPKVKSISQYFQASDPKKK